MLCIAKTTDRATQKCCACDRMIDLTDGGLYFHYLIGGELQPICPWCTAQQDSVLAMCGAIYARAVEGYNRANPHNRFNIALLDALSPIEEELEKELLSENGAETVDA